MWQDWDARHIALRTCMACQSLCNEHQQLLGHESGASKRRAAWLQLNGETTCREVNKEQARRDMLVGSAWVDYH